MDHYKTEITNTVDTRTEPVDTRTEPVDTWTEPVDTWTEPVDTWTEPVDTWTEPVDTRTEPVDTWTGPVDTRTGPVDTRTKPVDTRTEPVDTRTEPVTWCLCGQESQRPTIEEMLQHPLIVPRLPATRPTGEARRSSATGSKDEGYSSRLESLRRSEEVLVERQRELRLKEKELESEWLTPPELRSS